MPIIFPDFQTLVNRVRADVSSALPGLDPTLRNSLIDAIVVACAGRAKDLYDDMQRLIREYFPQTASLDFLDLQGEIFGVTRLPASRAVGVVNYETSIAGLAIPLGTLMSSSDGLIYETTASAVALAVSLGATSVTRAGSVVTFLASSAHGLATGQTVTISGAVEVNYNGSFIITVISEFAFTYTITGTPTSPATGTILAAAIYAPAPARALENGEAGNKDSGAAFEFVTPIVSYATGYANFFGLAGGADTETDSRYRQRIIYTRANLEALFDEAQIVRTVLQSVPGATRVQVKKIYPVIGAVTVYFVKDDDPISIIPTPGDVAAALAGVLAITPAHTSPSDVYVLAPTPIPVNFAIDSLTPDTPELRAAILSNLDAFFREQISIEESITQDKYRGIIVTSADPLTGVDVESFNLTSPIGDIVIGVGEIAILGTVVFA